MPDSHGDATSLEMLADYECSNCGSLAEDGYGFTEHDASEILGGDEHGFLRCPVCGSELELTLDAALDVLKMVAERHPDMAGEIADVIEQGVAR